MKAMLITAAVVGTAVAGFLLYVQQKEKPKNYLKSAVKETRRNLKSASATA